MISRQTIDSRELRGPTSDPICHAPERVTRGGCHSLSLWQVWGNIVVTLMPKRSQTDSLNESRQSILICKSPHLNIPPVCNAFFTLQFKTLKVGKCNLVKNATPNVITLPLHHSLKCFFKAVVWESLLCPVTDQQYLKNSSPESVIDGRSPSRNRLTVPFSSGVSSTISQTRSSSSHGSIECLDGSTRKPPEPLQGVLLKSRKRPMKGWHEVSPS